MADKAGVVPAQPPCQAPSLRSRTGRDTCTDGVFGGGCSAEVVVGPLSPGSLALADRIAEDTDMQRGAAP